MARRSGRNRSRKASRANGLFARRSVRGWAGRIALALGLATFGVWATATSMAQVAAKADPARAHAMAPGDGKILGEYAQEAFARKPVAAPASLPARLAREALLADATAAEALTVLGFQAELRGDTAQAKQIFAYSQVLTRRELRPRMWAIEEAVSRGDIHGALRNYDIALRISDDAAAMLFPTLSAALVEPRVRAALLRVLDTDPVWTDAFVAYAANSGIEPEGAIAFFSESGEHGIEPSAPLRANLVNALMAQDKPREAWNYYRTFRADAHRDQSRDPTFSLDTDVRAAFDWQARNDARISAAILREGDGGLLDFTVPPSVGGELVRQVQLLPTGRYRLAGQSRGVDQREYSRPYWALSCQDGRLLGRVPLANSAENQGKFSGEFVVPPNCTVQILALFARSTDDIMGVSGQIVRAQLTRIGQ